MKPKLFLHFTFKDIFMSCLVLFSHLCLEYIGVLNLHCLPWDKVFIEVDTEVCLGRTVKGCGLKAPDLAECENSSAFKPVVLV